MKGIVWYFKQVISEDKEKSTWPKGIREHREFEKEKKEFRDVVGVWLTVEKDDREEYLDSLVNRVVELNDQFYKKNVLVVLPFVHLSNKIETPKRAKEMLQLCCKKFEQAGFKVHRLSFGTHKRVLWEIPGDVAEASYFEF